MQRATRKIMGITLTEVDLFKRGGENVGVWSMEVQSSLEKIFEISSSTMTQQNTQILPLPCFSLHKIAGYAALTDFLNH